MSQKSTRLLSKKSYRVNMVRMILVNSQILVLIIYATKHKFARLIQSADMNDKQVLKLLAIANNDLTALHYRYEALKREKNSRRRD